MKNFAILFLIILASVSSYGQCISFLQNPADTIGWVHGASEPSHPGHYNNDTFVLCNAHGGENNYLYNTFPTTLYGTASTFSMSFDFRIDSNQQCSDGLTFWFFTSGLSGLGQSSKEGGNLGFPDTVSGFALAFRTIFCVDEIYMKKINSNQYNWSGGSGNDTNICASLSQQMFLTDSQWHHCIVNYDHGNITTSFDGGRVIMSGYSPIYGTGHFGFMGTNGGGYSRKTLKNIQLCAGLGTPTYAAAHFGSYINRECNGPLVTVQTKTYSTSYNVKTYYGDGSHDSAVIQPALSGGYALFTHNYNAPGHYTITQKLYSGITLIDSLSFLYENVFCATLPIKFYYDVNGDCLYEPGEPSIIQPIRTEVDSNGIPIDTISATSGFYYDVRGSIGTVYSFKILSVPGNMYKSCPASGIIYDSLVPGIFIYPIKYFGLNCGSGNSYDLSVNALVPVTGVHDQWGNIYLQNSYCAPTNGTVTMTFSPKYNGTTSQITPAPVSVSGNSITWNLSALTSNSPKIAQLHYQANYNGTPLTIGDTVMSSFSITPSNGDANPANNSIVIIDTIRAACDPNEMWVTPAGCIPASIAARQLQYRINFENTGNDTAHNIYVMDTLAANVDVSTFNVVASTNEMYVSKLRSSAGQNILKFDFPNINLLDSTHHGQCDGGLIFKINTIGNLVDGATVNNRAGIYFDVNSVVLTNTATNTVGTCIAQSVPNVLPAEAQIYPNPATNVLTIKTTAGSYNSFVITNTLGTHVAADKINSVVTNVALSTLPAGVYFIILQSEQGSKVEKFVKM